MIRFITQMIRIITGVTGLLAGQAVLSSCVGMYGSPPIPHDPTVALTDFSYSPASPVSVGDRIRFEGRTNKPTNAGNISVWIETNPRQNVWLNDNGALADETPGDGIWTGDLIWSIELGTDVNIPVQLELNWLDGHPSTTLDGPPLTVLPEDELGAL